MKRSRPKEDPAEVLRRVAMAYPEAKEGVACAGRVLEKRTITVRKKAFLFLGAAEALLKLGGSLDAAAGEAANAPGRFKVGAHGWVTITFGEVKSLPIDLLTEWLDESYRLMAPKQLVALLPEQGTTGEGRKKTKRSAIQSS